MITNRNLDGSDGSYKSEDVYQTAKFLRMIGQPR